LDFLVSSRATAVLICLLLQYNRIQGEEREEAEGARTMVGILGGIEDFPQTTQTRESTSTPTLVRLIACWETLI
jgi:hypothetical protein